MRPQSEEIIKTYNATADDYAAVRIDELSEKHIDPEKDVKPRVDSATQAYLFFSLATISGYFTRFCM